MAFGKRVVRSASYPYGTAKVGKTQGKLGKLAGSDNPDGRGVWDKGVQVRGRRK